MFIAIIILRFILPALSLGLTTTSLLEIYYIIYDFTLLDKLS